MIQFLAFLQHNLTWGFPFWWSVRTAWAHRKGPNEKLKAMRRQYEEIMK